MYSTINPVGPLQTALGLLSLPSSPRLLNLNAKAMMAYSLGHAPLAFHPSQQKHRFPGFVFKPAITQGTEGLVNPGEGLYAQQRHRASSPQLLPGQLCREASKAESPRTKAGVSLCPGVSLKTLLAERVQLPETADEERRT